MAAEIDVLGNGISIPDGDTSPRAADDTDFGAVDVNSGATTHRFTIRNAATQGTLSKLGVSNVSIVGPNSSSFQIVAQALPARLAEGAATTFDVRFDPTVAGINRATIVIDSSDTNEDPYEIAIQGTGQQGQPEVSVSGKNGREIFDTDNTPSDLDGTDIGPVLLGQSKSLVFRVQNLGTSPLLLTGTPRVRLDGGSQADDFRVLTFPNSSIHASSSSGGEFTVLFTPTVAQQRDAIVTISTNDTSGGEDVYTFRIRGFGVTDLVVQDPDGRTLVDGSSDQFDLGAYSVGATAANFTFRLANGTQTAATIVDFQTPAWVEKVEGLANTVPGLAFDPFTLRLKTDQLRVRNPGDVVVRYQFAGSSTVEEFRFKVTGQVNAPAAPVTVGATYDGRAVADNDAAPLNLGSFTVGQSQNRRFQFTVINNGPGVASLGNLSVPSGMTIVEGISSTLAPQATDTFTVELDTSAPRALRGTIAFETNDADLARRLFQINVSASVTASTVTSPELPVVQLNSPNSGTFLVGDTVVLRGSATHPAGISHVQVELYQGGVAAANRIGVIYRGNPGDGAVDSVSWTIPAEFNGRVLGGRNYQIKWVAWSDEAVPVPAADYSNGAFNIDASHVERPLFSPPWGAGAFNYYSGRSFFYDSDHLGADILLAEGSPVQAGVNGILKYYGPAPGYGSLLAVVEVDLGAPHTFTNAYGVTTDTRKALWILGHLRKSELNGGGGETLDWRVGDAVTSTDVLGFVERDADNGDGAEHLHIGLRLQSYDQAIAEDGGKFARGYEGATSMGARFADPIPLLGVPVAVAKAPAAPAGSVVGPNTILLSYGAAAGAGTFHLYRADSPAGPWGSPIYSGADRNYRDSGAHLIAGKSYYYRLATSNADGLSPLSPIAKVSLAQHALPSPHDLQSAVTPENAIQLTWAGEATQGAYVVERSSATQDAFRPIASVPYSQTTYVDHDASLLPNVPYAYRVWSSAGALISSYSNVASATIVVSNGERTPAFAPLSEANRVAYDGIARLYQWLPASNTWQRVESNQLGPTLWGEKNVFLTHGWNDSFRPDDTSHFIDKFARDFELGRSPAELVRTKVFAIDWYDGGSPRGSDPNHKPSAEADFNVVGPVPLDVLGGTWDAVQSSANGIMAAVPLGKALKDAGLAPESAMLIGHSNGAGFMASLASAIFAAYASGGEERKVGELVSLDAPPETLAHMAVQSASPLVGRISNYFQPKTPHLEQFALSPSSYALNPEGILSASVGIPMDSPVGNIRNYALSASISDELPGISNKIGHSQVPLRYAESADGHPHTAPWGYQASHFETGYDSDGGAFLKIEAGALVSDSFAGTFVPSIVDVAAAGIRDAVNGLYGAAHDAAVAQADAIWKLGVNIGEFFDDAISGFNSRIVFPGANSGFTGFGGGSFGGGGASGSWGPAIHQTRNSPVNVSIDVVIPEAAAYLTYNLDVLTAGGTDVLQVAVGDELVGEVDLRMHQLSNGAAISHWIGSHAGETTQIRFYLPPDGTGPTEYLISNLRFETITNVAAPVVQGVLWDDVDGDGVRESGEPYVSGANVHLVVASTGTRIASGVTNAHGEYRLTGQVGTQYYVEVESPSGRRFTVVDQGGDDAVDSDVNAVSGRSPSFTFTAGGTTVAYDAGLVPITLDSKLDLLVTNSYTVTASGLFGDGAGGFSAPGSLGTTHGSAAVGDFNEDGAPDVVLINASTDVATIRFGLGQSQFGNDVTFPAGDPGTSSVHATQADVNNDGHLDLLVNGNGSNKVYVHLGRGDGTFLPYVGYAVGNNPRTVAAGDFNGDGWIDLATCNDLSANVSVLMNTGTGTFGAATHWSMGFSPRGIAVADYNGDGRSDIATANQGSGTVTVRMSLASGGFSNATSVAAAGRAIASLDIDGDGDLDLATASEGPNVYVLRNDGSGAFTVTGAYQPVANAFYLAAGDFNGDGRPDLAVTDMNSNIANYTSSSVGVMLGDGVGGFSSTVHVPVASGVFVYAVELNGEPRFGNVGDRVWRDMNGNGLQDSGEPGVAGVTVRLLSAAGAVVATTTTDASGGYSFHHVALGDYQIEVDRPDGYKFSPADQGDDGGSRTYDFGSDDSVARMIRQADGKIVLVGGTKVGGTPVLAILRTNADGTPDVSFGAQGKVVVSTLGGAGAATSVVQQADGKLVIAGYATQGPIDALTLVRLNTDGSLDATFGTGGVVKQAIGSSHFYTPAVALQSDGKIVVGGGAASAGVARFAFAAVRFSASGTLDTSFGDGGVKFIDFGPSDDRANNIRVLADDSILLLGRSINASVDADFRLVKLTANGQLDTAFGSGGSGLLHFGVITFNSGDEIWDADVDALGRIVTVGYAAANSSGTAVDAAVARWLPSGALDTSFGAGGKMRITPGVTDDALGVAVLPDGRILVTGSEVAAGSSQNVLLSMLTTGGAVDVTFGNNGQFRYDFAGLADYATDAIVADDGSFIVSATAGKSPSSTGKDFGLVRVTATGQLASSFGPNELLDSDVVPATGRIPTFSLHAGSDTSLDAGLVPLRRIYGTVWYDADGDGLREIGEASAAGVRVNLLNGSGTLVASQDASLPGAFSFDDLPAGSFQVEVIAPPGTKFTLSDQGADDTTDSDADQATGRSTLINLLDAGDKFVFDAGLFAPRFLGDFVWEDLDGNGARDLNEPPVDLVVVQAYLAGPDAVLGTSDDVLAAGATSDSGGAYHFSDLADGQYLLVFTPPAGFAATIANATDDASDSDIDATTRGVTIQIAGLHEIRDVDAGFYRPATIQGQKWNDLDGDGQHDGGEPGLNGWTIELRNQQGMLVGTTTTAARDVNADGAIDSLTERGLYEFHGLRPGVYYVHELQQPGWLQTSPLPEETLLADDFNDNSLDGGKWRTTLPFGNSSVIESGQRIEVRNRGYLVSQQQFDPRAVGEVRISGRWKFTNATWPGHDVLQLLTRSDATPAGSYGETFNGIEFQVNGNDAVTIVENVNGSGTILAGPVPFTVNDNDEFEFEARDDGTHLTFIVTRLSDGRSVTLEAVSNRQFAANYFVLHNREANNGSATLGYLDDFRLTTGAAGHALVIQSGAVVAGRDFGNQAAPGSAPTVDLNGGASGTDYATNFVENSSAVAVVGANATVADADSQFLSTVTATITNRVDGAAETLAADTAGTSLTQAFVDGKLTLTGPATIADFQRVVRTLTYRNHSENPTAGLRTIQFLASDGLHEGTPVVASIDVTAVNDAPTIIQGSDLLIDRGAIVPVPGLSVGDVDLSPVDPVEVTLLVSHGALSFGTLGGVRVVAGANDSANLTIRGVLADVNAALASLYYNQTDATWGGADHILLTVNDLAGHGAGGPLSATADVTVTLIGQSVSIASNQSSAAEGDSGFATFTFTLQRTGLVTGTAAVNYAVSGSGANPADAADFMDGMFPTGTVNFAANQTTATISVKVRGDTTVEPDEDFRVTLADPTNGMTLDSPSSTGGTIANDDVVAILLDDGAAAGYTHSTGPGYLGDAYYALANSGAVTTWTFSGLAAGIYQVAVTWPNSGLIGAPGNLASNATYSLNYGGGSKSLVVDQRSLPDDFVADGVAWEEFLGVINHTGGNLTVSLPASGINGQYVYADAVRVIQLVQPEIQVTDVLPPALNTTSGTTTLTFPTSFIRDTAPTRTLRIANVGSGNLALPDAATLAAALPAGFFVTSDPGTTSLASGATRDVVIRLATDPVADSAMFGAKSGSLTIANSDPNEASYSVGLAGFVETRMVVDNAQPAWYTFGRSATYGAIGAWRNLSQGFLNEERYVSANVSNTATFTLPNLPAGQYRVSATWKQNSAFATTTQYVVNGVPVTVNQAVAPGTSPAAGFTEILNGQTTLWQQLVTGLTVGAGGTITVVVRMPNTVSGKYMAADAIRVEWLNPQAADSPEVGAATGRTISAVDTGTLLAEAVRRWSQVEPDAVERLAQVQVHVQPLPAGVLGLASPVTQEIWLNHTAAGAGWYVDATPQWDEELSGVGPPLAGYDLLSTLAHELGHLLGYGDEYGSHVGLDTMAGELAAGVRSLPAPGAPLDTLPTRGEFARPGGPAGTVHDSRQTPRGLVQVAAEYDALFADLEPTDWPNVAVGDRPADPRSANGRGRRKERSESPDPREAHDELFARWE